ncbi:hypothetical protein WH47_07000 [Habropoda laboriosa]|uniref:Uncharacterized protein n=1 Tax=Habropoda laboriosa TaxID=597456 RepID=A0A0L7QRQ6_9HYME|nr:hypothetical protein WH47_07000 [Habropoda laboriosa]
MRCYGVDEWIGRQEGGEGGPSSEADEIQAQAIGNRGVTDRVHRYPRRDSRARSVSRQTITSKSFGRVLEEVRSTRKREEEEEEKEGEVSRVGEGTTIPETPGIDDPRSPGRIVNPSVHPIGGTQSDNGIGDTNPERVYQPYRESLAALFDSKGKRKRGCRGVAHFRSERVWGS